MSDDVATAPAMARTNAALIAAIVFVALSVPLTYWFFAAGFASAGDNAIGYFVTMNLFAAQDIWAGPVMALVLAVAWRWGGMGRIAARPIRVSVAIPVLAVVAVAASFVLRFIAHHNYALSLDEFMPTFQAEIFRSGAIMAPLSDRALAVHESLQPFFAYVDEERQVWIQHYRPIHAGLLSLFPAGLDQAVLHAILTGITVLALADIAKRVFPDRPGAPILVVLLLLASPQVLLTSASGFAFTTHLA